MKLAAYRLFLVVTMLLCVSGLRFVSLAQVKPASRSMSTKPAIANSVILRVRATRQEVSTEDTPVPRKTRRVSQSPRIASSSKRITDNAANAAAPTLKTKEEKPVLAGGVSLIKTDNQVSFLVYGEPIALQRHRMLRSGMTYNPSSKQQKQFLDTCRSFLPSTPLQGPLEVRLVFHFKRPMNHYGSGRNSNVLKDGMDLWHSKRKDVDNLVKFVLDSLNRVAYEDDGQVAVLSAAKLYTGEQARVEVHIRKLADADGLFEEKFGQPQEPAV